MTYEEYIEIAKMQASESWQGIKEHVSKLDGEELDDENKIFNLLGFVGSCAQMMRTLNQEWN